jgi:hypothetical protein
MAKKHCELCQLSESTDMRLGVNLCQDCVNDFSEAIIGNIDVAVKLSDPQNYPYATPAAREMIARYVSPKIGQSEPQKNTDGKTTSFSPSYAPPFGYEDNRSSFGLYSDIVKKIKGWAKWIFIIEALCAVIGGIVLLVSGEESLLIIGIITIIAGPFIALVSTWILYGFGELIDKTAANEENTRAILKIMMNNPK